jgi:hypothetical protein
MTRRVLESRSINKRLRYRTRGEIVLSFNINLWPLTSSKELFWVIYDWSTLSLFLSVQTYWLYVNSFINNLLSWFFLPQTKQTSLFTKSSSTVLKAQPSVEGNTLSPLPLSQHNTSHIILTYLTFFSNTSSSNRITNLSPLFNTITNPTLVAKSIFFYKKLFTTVDSILKPSLSIDPLNNSSSRQLNLPQLLTQGNFSSFTPLLVDFYS